MSFKFDMKDFSKKLNKRLERNKVKKIITESTLLVADTAKRSIQAGGKGIEYQKYNPRRTHRASAEGDPPATDTGFLVKNITMEIKTEKNAVIGQIRSSAPYSKHLEFGTVNIMPRPFMQPALEKNKAKIKRKFNQGILDK